MLIDTGRKAGALLAFISALCGHSAVADTLPCSPDDGPRIDVRELPVEEQHIGHPLEVTITESEGLSQVSLLESLRKRSFVEVVDGRTTMKMYLNYQLDPMSSHFIVVQASNNKGATRCRAYRVTTVKP